MTAEAFATPVTAQPSPGMPVGEGHFYADGFRPGDFKCSYGVLEQLLQLNPGWQLADGTVTLPDGTTPPDMRDRFIIGAGGALALGATGGSSTAPAHGHAFTQPTTHGFTPAQQTAGAAGWVPTQTSAANVTAALAHVGGAVGAVTGAGTSLPPYAALYILVKVS